MNDDAYDEFFRATYPGLVAMGLAMSAERHVAQDLAQETLLRAYRRWDDLQGYDAPLAWCRRVMGNLLIDQHRTGRAERSALERVESQVRTGESLAAIDPAQHAVATRWDDLVASLTPQQRLVATFYYAHDQSVGDVADTMQIATGTVKSALSKARRNLRRRLGTNPDSATTDEATS